MRIVLRFRIQIEDDNHIIYRDVDILNAQSLKALAIGLLDAFDFDPSFEGRFYTTDEEWRMLTLIQSLIPSVEEANEIPLNKIIQFPGQKLFFLYEPEGKAWGFQLSLMKVSKANAAQTIEQLPICVNRQGIPPAQYTAAEVEQNRLGFKPEKLLNIRSAIR